jgi:mannose-6-phosphate isomerase-like protein (cupin superfamily)
MIMKGKVWGDTSALFNKNNVEVHLINIKKGGFCSKHYHQHKYNLFIILEGKLKITEWHTNNKDQVTLEDITILQSGMSYYVNPLVYHRFEALEDTKALEIYWVELSESDIVREDQGGIKDETKADECVKNNVFYKSYKDHRKERDAWYASNIEI